MSPHTKKGKLDAVRESKSDLNYDQEDQKSKTQRSLSKVRSQPGGLSNHPLNT
jgi:hypothetical protein